MGLFSYLKSTILSKVVMALTGAIIVGFVLGHMVGNLQVFIGREAFNTYAHFLQNLGELLWLIRLFLLFCLVLHIITSIKLTLYNATANPDKYKVKAYVKSTLSSRTMIYGGIFIVLFLVFHLGHFTIGLVDPEIYGHIENYGPNGIFERHDAWGMVIAGFGKPLFSIIYVISMVFLALHLNHAIQSMLQTLGFSGPRFTPNMKKIGQAIAWLAFIGYSSIPIAIMLGFGGGTQ